MTVQIAGRRAALCLVFVLALLLPGGRGLSASATPPDPEAAAAGKLVISVPAGLNEATLRSLAARHGATVERWLPRLGLALLDVRVGDERAASTALATEDLVEFVAEHRALAHIADTPADEYWNQQWGMVKIEGPAAWDLAWGDPSVPVAIIDTGANYLQADLENQVWYNPGESKLDPATGLRSCDTPLAFNGEDDDGDGYVDDCRGYDFYARDNNPLDEHTSGHGTFVTGIAGAATNNVDIYVPGGYEGVAGTARNTRLMILRALGTDGRGYTLDIAEAIDYATARGARVINLSLTYSPTTSGDTYDMQMLWKAIKAAEDAGVLVVAAAGNENYLGIDYPAKFAGVMAVGASTSSDTRATFSNYGDRLDLVAPGEGIYGTLVRPGNRSYGYYGGSSGTSRGTSFASPHVAGVAALVRALRPDLTQDAVHELLRRSADDVAAAGFDIQTGWGRLNAASAVAEAIPGLALAVSTARPSVGVNGQATVQVRITAPGGAAAGLGGRVTLTADTGTVSPSIVTLDSNGTATAQYIAGSGPGPAQVTATFGPLSAMLGLTVTSGIPAALTLEAAPALIVTNGAAVITATVRDEGGNPVMSSVPVMFSASLGALDPSTTTTVEGRAVTHFTAGPTAGTATLQAEAAGFTASLPLTIVGAGQPYSLTLTADPAAMTVDGAGATLTATVLDAFGARVSDGIAVHFTTDRGTLSTPNAVTTNGQAQATLNPGTQAGNAHVTAQAGEIAGQLTVPIRAGQAAAVTLTAAPGQLTAGYNQIARLHATAADRYGNAVADGTVLQFTTTLGQLASASAQTQGGAAEVDLVGGLKAGRAEITARAPGGVQGSTSVAILPAAPAALDLSATPASITVGGEASRLTATVRDTYDNLVANGTVVTFTVDLGGLRPVPGVAAPAVTLAAQTANGVAQADFISAEAAGTANIRAAVTQALVDTLTISVQPGAASTLTLSVTPSVVRARGRAELSAWVTDRFGNPVADGTSVSFAVTAGQANPAVVPTSGGAALSWLTAPAQPGTIQVAAVSGSASDFETVTVEEGPPLEYLYLPLVMR